MSIWIDALIPALVMGVPMGLITLFSKWRELRRNPVHRILRGATKL